MSVFSSALACCALAGVVFAPPATAASEAVLFSFGYPAGQWPAGPLTELNGTLYGVTLQGGGNQTCAPWCGTVFSLTKSGVATTLYTFQGGSDGGEPPGGLIALDGTLYGTTSQNGNPGCYANYGCGTVFSITPAGVEKVIYSFKGGADAGSPKGSMVNIGGTLYGASFVGGASDAGTVFAVRPDGTERVVYSFKGGRDGARPDSGLTADGDTLYGTTAAGGGKGCGGTGCGTVFAVTIDGTERVLHRFNRPGDGSSPFTSSLLKVGDRLFGTTVGGGATGNGTVFSVTLGGRERVLHSFTGGADGTLPEASLIKVGGLLYGLANGGADRAGVVFSITPSGTENTVYSFSGPDGAGPWGGLLAFGGALYGVTAGGGGNGVGTAFSLVP